MPLGVQNNLDTMQRDEETSRDNRRLAEGSIERIVEQGNGERVLQSRKR